MGMRFAIENDIKKILKEYERVHVRLNNLTISEVMQLACINDWFITFKPGSELAEVTPAICQCGRGALRIHHNTRCARCGFPIKRKEAQDSEKTQTTI